MENLRRKGNQNQTVLCGAVGSPPGGGRLPSLLENDTASNQDHDKCDENNNEADEIIESILLSFQGTTALQ